MIKKIKQILKKLKNKKKLLYSNEHLVIGYRKSTDSWSLVDRLPLADTLFNASADILGRHESLPAEENLEKKSNLKICVG